MNSSDLILFGTFVTDAIDSAGLLWAIDSRDYLLIGAFLAVLMAGVGVYSVVSDLFLRDRSRLGRRVDEELSRHQREKAQKSELFKNRGFMPDDDDTSFRKRFEMMVEQSGLNLTPGKLAVYIGVGAFIGFVVGFFAPSRILGMAIGLVVGAAIPYVFVYMKWHFRMEKLTAQLPDAFDLMGRVIRAGQTMSQGLQAVADEFDRPISAEFSYCYEQQNLGLSPEISLRDLANRTGVLEIKIFVLAMLVQQQTGGNLAEMLDKLAGVMRERARIRGRIKALTAEGRLQAIILLFLPIVVLLAIALVNPTYAGELFALPVLLIITGVFMVLGALWIRKIINFDF